MDQQFKVIDEKEFVALFVNADREPDEIHPLDFFDIKDKEGFEKEGIVLRLCKLVYYQLVGDGTDEIVIKHSYLDWKECRVKKGSKASTRLIIESNKGINHFIE